MDEGRIENKEQLLEQLLDRGMVMVTVDARRPGVDVPARFQDDPQLRLNLSHRFGLPLEVNRWGVRATLTFGGVPHACKLPWPAVYQLFSHATGEHYLFPSDVPDDLPAVGGHAPEEEPPPPARRGRPRLSVVPAPGDGEKDAEAPPDEPPPEGGGRPQLRRIK